MQNKPVADVSMIVPNYNNGKYLDAFMQSVLASTLLPARLILVDDGSTDNSRQVLEKFQILDFFELIRFEKNRGLPAALNAALQRAGNKYIMRADPDDLLLPGRIEAQVNFLEDHPEIDVVGCNVEYFREEQERRVNASNFPLNPEKIARMYRRGEHGLMHATLCAQAAVYKNYRYQDVFPGEDYELLARMIRDGRRFANLKQVCYRVRLHPQSSTTNLDISSIKHTFAFRDKIFGTHTTKFRICFYFKYIRYYRKFQMCRQPMRAYGYLILAVLFYPHKLIRRLFKFAL